MPSTIITARWRGVRKDCGRNELRCMHTAHCAVKRSASVCSSILALELARVDVSAAPSWRTRGN